MKIQNVIYTGHNFYIVTIKYASGHCFGRHVFLRERESDIRFVFTEKKNVSNMDIHVTVLVC